MVLNQDVSGLFTVAGMQSSVTDLDFHSYFQIVWMKVPRLLFVRWICVSIVDWLRDSKTLSIFTLAALGH